MSSRGLRWAAAIAVGLAALAVASERAGWLRARAIAVAPGAVWIWGPSDPRALDPKVFFAARDFQLDSAPERAELRILADEEYVVYLNGARIGADRWRPGAPLDRYEVGRDLASGANRLVVELRSSSGTGGLLCEIVDPASGRVWAESDASWSLYPAYWPGLLGGHALIPASAPLVWGAPPIGRWGNPALDAPLPLFDEATRGQAIVPAWRWRDLAAGSGWRRVRPGRSRARLGPWVEFDFGGPVCGYLQIDHAAPDSRPALLRTADEPSQLPGWRADAVVVTAGGRGWWQDALPRCFRYATVAGLEPLLSVAVMSVDPALRASLPGPVAPPPGLFGLRPPVSRTPVENEIWSELERRAGVAVR